jgi:L-amino acid N-acyltransferase YncA
MIVREPMLDDVLQLYNCIIPYAGMSRQGKEVAVNPAVVMQSLSNVIQADNFVKQMVVIDGQVAGLAFGHYCQTWWTEPDCDVSFLYVAQTGRGVGRLLVQSMIDSYKSLGCGWMYAGAESDVNAQNTKQYENLFKKFGFNDIGGGRMILNLRGN